MKTASQRRKLCRAIFISLCISWYTPTVFAATPVENNATLPNVAIGNNSQITNASDSIAIGTLNNIQSTGTLTYGLDTVIGGQNTIKDASKIGMFGWLNAIIGDPSTNIANQGTVIGQQNYASGTFKQSLLFGNSNAVGKNVVRDAKGNITSITPGYISDGYVFGNLNTLDQVDSSIVIGRSNSFTQTNAVSAIGGNNTANSSFGSSITGLGNRITNATGSSVIGINNTINMTNSPSGLEPYLPESLSSQNNIIGIKNSIMGTSTRNSVIGTSNSLTGASTNNFISGFGNTLGTNLTNTQLIGSKSSIAANTDYGVLIGSEGKLGADNAIAIGKQSQAMGKNSISIGTGNIVNGANSGAIGDPSYIDADNSYAIGNNNSILANTSGSFVLGNDNSVTTSDTQVIGSGINRKADGTTVIGDTVANSVYLGNNSQATAGNGIGTANTNSEGVAGTTTTAGDKGTVSDATVNNINYSGFAGATASGAVTVGAAGTERRIQNIAAGEISATSTDAINGSQLYAVASAIGNMTDTNTYTTGGTYDAATKQINFTQNDPTKNYSVDVSALAVGGSTSDYQLIGKNGAYGDAGAYTVSDDNKITLTVKDSLSGNSNDVVINDVAKASDVAKGWTSQIDGQDVSNIKMGEKQNFISGDNIQLTNDNGAIKVSTKRDVDFGTVNAVTVRTGDTTINDNGLTVTGGPTITKTEVNVAGNKITNVQAGTAPLDAVNVSQLNDLGNRVDKVGAGAAALAALHPLDFDPDEKWSFASGYGNYRGDNAFAVGAFYRPNEDTMFSLGGTFGNGDNMIAVGASFKLGQTNHVSNTRVAMAKEMKDLRKELETLKSALIDVNAGKKLDTSKLQLFPDVPENHWAYEYVATLAGNGIIKGYLDGQFEGNRPMTRYEFAAMLYRSMMNGAKLSDKILAEFAPELERIRVDVIYSDKDGNPTVERVRVIKDRG